MPYEPPAELATLTLAQIADLVEQRKLPAVEGWAPQTRGDSRMRIAADGTWFHNGMPITRPAMVRAFSGLLTCDSGEAHWLMTPFEKLSIEVEDAPFIAVDVAQTDGSLAFRLNTDDLVVAGPNNALVARGDAERPALYLHVRRDCMARLNRSTYEQLAQIALDAGDDWTVTSGGQTFTLRPG
jgi:hypothetical protein